MEPIDRTEEPKDNQIVELRLDYEIDDNNKESYLKSIFGENLNLKDPELTFRMKMQRLLESNKFHLIVIILVLLDTICVTVELIISLENKNDNKTLDEVEEFLKIFGVTILSVFLVEILLKIIFNTHHFIHSKLEIFDGVIVVISFALDISFFDQNASPAIGLITILRLWRIARIVNGTIVTIENRAEAKQKKLKQMIDALKTENRRLVNELTKKDAIINEFKIKN